MTPSKSAEAFSAVKLRATFAAPPGMKLSRSKSTTGTGASGEMRDTQPQMNWSSITSPTTSTRVRVAARKMPRTRPGGRNVGFMAGREWQNPNAECRKNDKTRRPNAELHRRGPRLRSSGLLSSLDGGVSEFSFEKGG